MKLILTVSKSYLSVNKTFVKKAQMACLGKGVESVRETLSFCCITRFHIEDHNAPAMLYTRTLASKCKSVFPDTNIKS